MKFLLTCVVSLLLLTACHLTPEERAQLGAGLGGAIRTIDRDGDRMLSKEEVRAAPGSTDVWLYLLMTLLGGAAPAGVALARASQANGEAKRAASGVDELWDKTHKPAS